MTETTNWLTASAVAVTLTAAGVIGLTGCGVVGAGQSPVDGNAAVLQACPVGKAAALRAAIDMSGTRVLEPLSDADEAAVRSAVQRVAVCGGPVEMAAFEGSVSTTASLYSGTLRLDGSTDAARLRREPDLTDSVMAASKQGLQHLQVGRSIGGSDILGQVAQSAEYRDQVDPLGTAVQMSVVIVSDGIDNEQLHLDDPSLTREGALQQADAAIVPDLTGVDFAMIGVGKASSSTAAGTPYVDALKAAWTRICERTNAASCTIVTDPATGH